MAVSRPASSSRACDLNRPSQNRPLHRSSWFARPCQVLVQAAHVPTDIAQPLSPSLDDSLCRRALGVQRLTAAPTLHERGCSKQPCPSLYHFGLRPTACLRGIDVQHEVIVIAHHGIGAYLDREVRAQLLDASQHPLLAMRIVLPCVFIDAPEPRSSHAPSDAVVVARVL